VVCILREAPTARTDPVAGIVLAAGRDRPDAVDAAVAALLAQVSRVAVVGSVDRPPSRSTGAIILNAEGPLDGSPGALARAIVTGLGWAARSREVAWVLSVAAGGPPPPPDLATRLIAAVAGTGAAAGLVAAAGAVLPGFGLWPVAARRPIAARFAAGTDDPLAAWCSDGRVVMVPLRPS